MTWKAQGESTSPFSTVVGQVTGKASDLRDLTKLNDTHRDEKVQIK